MFIVFGIEWCVILAIFRYVAVGVENSIEMFKMERKIFLYMNRDETVKISHIVIQSTSLYTDMVRLCCNASNLFPMSLFRSFVSYL